MKRACLTNGIFTPKYVFIYDLNKDMKLLDQLTFPMIVKHYNSAGSWDMTRQSKVTNK
jgi:glutathione synthase/RimK-type ligase-like ATP-grasp enzyme